MRLISPSSPRELISDLAERVRSFLKKFWLVYDAPRVAPS